MIHNSCIVYLSMWCKIGELNVHLLKPGNARSITVAKVHSCSFVNSYSRRVLKEAKWEGKLHQHCKDPY